MKLLRTCMEQTYASGSSVLSWLTHQQWLHPAALQLLMRHRLLPQLTHWTAGAQRDSTEHHDQVNHVLQQWQTEKEHSLQCQLQHLQPSTSSQQVIWVGPASLLQHILTFQSTTAVREYAQRDSSSGITSSRQQWPLLQLTKCTSGLWHLVQQRRQISQTALHKRQQTNLKQYNSAADMAVLRCLRDAKRARDAGCSEATAKHLQQALDTLLLDLKAASLHMSATLLRSFNTAGLSVAPHSLQRVLQHLAHKLGWCTLQHIHAAALAVTAAEDPQCRQLLQPLAQRALQLRIEQIQSGNNAALSPQQLTHTLWLHEVAGEVPVPPQQMQALLAHAAATAQQYAEHQGLRVLLHAKQSGLPAQPMHNELLDRSLQLLLQRLPQAAPVDVCRMLQAFEDVGVIMPHQQLQQLVDQVVVNITQCSSKHAVRVIRSAAYAGLQLQPDTLQLLVQTFTATGGTENKSHIIQMLKAVSHMGQQIEQQQLEHMVRCLLHCTDPQLSMPPTQAGTVLKALACMGQTLPEQLLKPLLQPLQHEAWNGNNMQHVATLLLTARQSDTQAGHKKQQIRPLLKLAKAALRREAEAAVGADYIRGGRPHPTCGQEQHHERSTAHNLARSTAQQQKQQLPTSVTAELLRALLLHDQVLAAGQVVPLTAAFLAKQPTGREIATYFAAIGGMYLAVDALQAAALVQRVCQAEQLPRMTAGAVGMLLWGLASMGYALDPKTLQVLVQQQLQQAKLPTAYNLAQTLWAIANMGSSNAQQQEWQQQLQPVLSPHLIQQLLRLLYKAVLLERRAGSSSSSSDGSVSAAMHWHLSVAAWAAAVCDARSCQQDVLQLCSLLAEPAVWPELRTSELVQLAWVHLWLCDYVWSDTKGLAACLSQQQLEDVRAAVQYQVAYVASGATHSSNSLLHPQQLDSKESRAEHCLSSYALHKRSSSCSGAVMQQRMMPLPPRVQRRRELMTPGPSASQRLLFTVVCSLPSIIRASLESITPDRMFSVDIEATTTAGQLLAIEFDGPFHFATLLPGSSALEAGAAAGPSDTPQAAADTATQPGDVPPYTPHLLAPASLKLGSRQFSSLVWKHTTLFRNRALEASGHTVVTIPFFSWPERGTLEAQQHLVQQAIDCALARRKPQDS